MKKILRLVTTSVLTLTLVACGNNSSQSASSKTTSQGGQQQSSQQGEVAVSSIVVSSDAESLTQSAGAEKSVNFYANFNAGANPAAVEWFVNDAKQSASASVFAYKPSGEGSFEIYAQVGSVKSNKVTLKVGKAPVTTVGELVLVDADTLSLVAPAGCTISASVLSAKDKEVDGQGLADSARYSIADEKYILDFKKSFSAGDKITVSVNNNGSESKLNYVYKAEKLTFAASSNGSNFDKETGKIQRAHASETTVSETITMTWSLENKQLDTADVTFTASVPEAALATSFGNTYKYTNTSAKVTVSTSYTQILKVDKDTPKGEYVFTYKIGDYEKSYKIIVEDKETKLTVGEAESSDKVMYSTIKSGKVAALASTTGYDKDLKQLKAEDDGSYTITKPYLDATATGTNIVAFQFTVNAENFAMSENAVKNTKSNNKLAIAITGEDGTAPKVDTATGTYYATLMKTKSTDTNGMDGSSAASATNPVSGSVIYTQGATINKYAPVGTKGGNTINKFGMSLNNSGSATGAQTIAFFFDSKTVAGKYNISIAVSDEEGNVVASKELVLNVKNPEEKLTTAISDNGGEIYASFEDDDLEEYTIERPRSVADYESGLTIGSKKIKLTATVNNYQSLAYSGDVMADSFKDSGSKSKGLLAFETSFNGKDTTGNVLNKGYDTAGNEVKEPVSSKIGLFLNDSSAKLSEVAYDSTETITTIEVFDKENASTYAGGTWKKTAGSIDHAVYYNRKLYVVDTSGTAENLAKNPSDSSSGWKVLSGDLTSGYLSLTDADGNVTKRILSKDSTDNNLYYYADYGSTAADKLSFVFGELDISNKTLVGDYTYTIKVGAYSKKVTIHVVDPEVKSVMEIATFSDGTDTVALEYALDNDMLSKDENGVYTYVCATDSNGKCNDVGQVTFNQMLTNRAYDATKNKVSYSIDVVTPKTTRKETDANAAVTWDDVNAVSRLSGEKFLSTATYNVGDIVYYDTDAKFYKCIKKIATGAAWDEDEWAEVEGFFSVVKPYPTSGSTTVGDIYYDGTANKYYKVNTSNSATALATDLAGANAGNYTEVAATSIKNGAQKSSGTSIESRIYSLDNDNASGTGDTRFDLDYVGDYKVTVVVDGKENVFEFKVISSESVKVQSVYDAPIKSAGDMTELSSVNLKKGAIYYVETSNVKKYYILKDNQTGYSYSASDLSGGAAKWDLLGIEKASEKMLELADDNWYTFDDDMKKDTSNDQAIAHNFQITATIEGLPTTDKTLYYTVTPANGSESSEVEYKDGKITANVYYSNALAMNTDPKWKNSLEATTPFDTKVRATIKFYTKKLDEKTGTYSYEPFGKASGYDVKAKVLGLDGDPS